MSVPETEQETAMPDESRTALPATANEEIAAWCEPKPPKEEAGTLEWTSAKGFWKWSYVPGLEDSECEWVPRYNFTVSRDACAEFERLVEERGLWPEYAVEFITEGRSQREWALYDAKPGTSGYCVSAFISLTTDAEQRCAAMLRVIRETKGEFRNQNKRRIP